MPDKNAAVKNFIEKLALNAQKARRLAKQVGLKPEPGTQWKWALRQMRKANPEGKKTDELMQSGKELRKTKEDIIGLISNNEKQKLTSIVRKQKDRYEAVLDDSGKVHVGHEGGVDLDELPVNPKAHNHPKVTAQSRNSDRFEQSRLGDDILAASPSGTQWDYTQRQVNKNKSKLKNYLREAKEDLEIFGPDAKTTPAIKYRLAKKFARRDAGADVYRGDLHQLQEHPNIKHNILAEKTTGVHKWRGRKLPRGLRSVYFKDGWGK